MKKRGFTLIELLAVIVVLAIIALIATPIVMNVIKKANEGAAERSADNYIKAVETLIATEKLDGTPLVDGTYTIESDGTLKGNGETYTVEVSGTKPVGGTIVIKDGQVVKADTTIDYTDHTVKFENGKAKAEEKGAATVLCRAIDPVAQPLFNGDTFEMVDTEVGVRATEDDKYAAGAVYSCDLGETEDTKGLIFYVLKEEGNNVKLLMSENIGSTVKWCASGSANSCNGDGAIEHLNLQTTGWKYLSDVNGTVTLPKGQDIADAMGDGAWNDGNWTGTYGPNWMVINLNTDMSIDGYWTLTPSSNQSNIAWSVYIDGTLDDGYSTVDYTGYGVRPMIIISKDNMSL